VEGTEHGREEGIDRGRLVLEGETEHDREEGGTGSWEVHVLEHQEEDMVFEIPGVREADALEPGDFAHAEGVGRANVVELKLRL